MEGKYQKWQVIQDAINVAEGKIEKSIWCDGSIDRSNFLYLLTSDVFENGATNEDMISYVRTSIRNWRISQIQGNQVDDIFIITLPSGEKIQLLPDLGKVERVGIRRIESDDVLWIPLIGRSGYQGVQGSQWPSSGTGFYGPQGLSGKKIESSNRTKYLDWIDVVDSALV